MVGRPNFSVWVHLRPAAFGHRGEPGRGSIRLGRGLLAGLLLGFGAASPTPSDAAPGPAPTEQAAPAIPPTLASHLDAILSEPFLAGAQVSVAVVDLATGKPIYGHNPDLALNPASNIKLVTTAAALRILGPAHRYTTRIYHDEEAVHGDTIKGDLYLRGGGDPALTSEDLYAIAGDLRAQGIRRISGGIVVDSTAFDRDELPPGFDQKDELAAYRAPSGATSVNFNTFVVHVRPGARAEAKPHVAVDPVVPGIVVVNDATTRDGRLDRLTAQIETAKQRTTLTLGGTIGLDAGARAYRYPVAAPSRYAGEVLAVALKHRGIRVGRTRVKLGAVPDEAELLAVHHSEPLSVLIRAVNKYSNNFMAEHILKTIASDGGPATFAAALVRARQFLSDIGAGGEDLRLDNGSGLYDNNRISARALTKLLAVMYDDFRVQSDFLASLSIMGVDGTTRRRLGQSPYRGILRAKTGTLDGVYCLSGYVGANHRAPLAFSILINGLPRAQAGTARSTQNRMVELMARHAAGDPLVDPVAPVGTAEPADASEEE